MQAVYCTICSTPHIDHYICNECKNKLFSLYIDDKQRKWKYCPYCGHKLHWSNVTEQQEEIITLD